jgi:hypothetical protein
MGSPSRALSGVGSGWPRFIRRRALFVRLQDLPKKVSRRILRSVTWTGVDAALPAHSLLRHLVVQLNRIGGRASIWRAAAVRLFH